MLVELLEDFQDEVIDTSLEEAPGETSRELLEVTPRGILDKTARGNP